MSVFLHADGLQPHASNQHLKGHAYPMMATETPGKWPVRLRICSVTSCRSNSVRPQLGQLTYSVLVFRMRQPCTQGLGSQQDAWLLAQGADGPAMRL